MRFNSQSLVLALASQAVAYPWSQLKSHNNPVPNPKKAQAIKEAFRASWEGYRKYAMPHDTLLPISRSFEDDRNQWGLTAIDAFSTAIIMDEADIVDEILDFALKPDFTRTKKQNETVSVFETTIRYLGGLLSAYDLLQGPKKDLNSNPEAVHSLLDQARILADSLSIAFVTPSGVPDGDVILSPTRRRKGNTDNSIAGFGTLVLEWTHLSDLTGNKKYAKLAQRAEDYLLHPTGSPEAWPGLVGSSVSLETGEFLDSAGGWSGGTDSFYEYLIKMYLYDREAFGEYKDRWILAADSTIKHLASHPTSRENLTFLSQFDGKSTYPSSGHLTSFAGGNFILGGILLDEQKYIDFGLKLAESYYETYRGTASGVGPEIFSWVDSANPGQGPPADKTAFYDKAGFWATAPDYILRPETMESLYYAYRATGDIKYQDLAWEAFQHIDAACRAGAAFSGLKDVTQPLGGGWDDVQQSFWLAETLKYLYLIFAPDAPFQIQSDKPNEWVFNTEAHPVKIRG